MSRIALPAEKIAAVAAIYNNLNTELDLGLVPSGIGEGRILDPRVQAALIDAAVRIAMSTDTRDMGILAHPLPPRTSGELRKADPNFEEPGLHQLHQALDNMDPVEDLDAGQ